MADPPPEVHENYKSEIVEAERLTGGAGRLEFVRTQEIIRRHLPSESLRILDVGAERERTPSGWQMMAMSCT